MRKVHFDVLGPERRSSICSEDTAPFSYELPLRRAPVIFIIIGLIIAVIIAAAVAVYLMINATQNVQIFQLFNSTDVLLNLTLTGVDCLGNEDDCRRPNSSLVCEERGVCKCGHCECSFISEKSNFTGQYCECGQCPVSLNGTVCSNRGVCECGVCRCDLQFDGEACERELDFDKFIKQGSEFNSTLQEKHKKPTHFEKAKEDVSHQHTT